MMGIPLSSRNGSIDKMCAEISQLQWICLSSGIKFYAFNIDPVTVYQIYTLMKNPLFLPSMIGMYKYICPKLCRKLLSFKMINHIICSQNSPLFHRTICHVAEYHLSLIPCSVCAREVFISAGSCRLSDFTADLLSIFPAFPADFIYNWQYLRQSGSYI